jgi:hypothetical protein
MRVTAETFGSAAGAVRRVSEAPGRPAHVVKVLSPHAQAAAGLGAGKSERAGDYWARERWFYESGVLRQGLPLSAPRLLGVEPQPDGTVWLRLEEVREPATPWSMPDYHRAAGHLGAFSGEYLRDPVPDPPAWLSRSWLRWWFAATVPPLGPALRGLSPAQRSMLAPVLDADQAAGLVDGLWRHRGELFRRLSAAPVVLSHLDAHRQNLLRAGEDRTVAIDWSYVGLEVLGADPAQCFASSAMRLLLPAAELAEHRAAVREGFLGGLRGAGCPAALLGQAGGWLDLAVCLRWGATHLFWIRRLADPDQLRTIEERWWRRPLAEAAEDLGRLHRFMARLVRDTCEAA